MSGLDSKKITVIYQKKNDVWTISKRRLSEASPVANRALEPTLLSGQMHGGIAQGVGQSLLENMVFDPDTGQVLTASFMDYAMPRADLLPDLNFTIREVPTKVNPVGAKGVGEAGSVGSLVAAHNAVCNALAPLGVTHMDMPLSPARVWQAIQDARS